MSSIEQPSEEVQLYIALVSLLSCAALVVYLGAKQVLQEIKTKSPVVEELMSTSDALALPFVGSMVLFSIYVFLRFVPLAYINILMSFLLSIVSVFSLGSFMKGYIRPNVLTGIFCCAAAVLYYLTNNWVVNNILAISIAVSAISGMRISSFYTSFVMLLGLFFYDIFWVFGSDVMLTVASGINGPIKLLFPRTIFGDHTATTLLGLGDLIIPGFFIAQTLVFSSEYVRRKNFYFYVALVAYILSLVNTMCVMVIFKHGQPALLFIVPWLLITFLISVIIKGDMRAALSFTYDEVAKKYDNSSKKKEDIKRVGLLDKKFEDEEGFMTLFTCFWIKVKELFGYENEEADNDFSEKQKTE